MSSTSQSFKMRAESRPILRSTEMAAPVSRQMKCGEWVYSVSTDYSAEVPHGPKQVPNVPISSDCLSHRQPRATERPPLEKQGQLPLWDLQLPQNAAEIHCSHNSLCVITVRQLDGCRSLTSTTHPHTTAICADTSH